MVAIPGVRLTSAPMPTNANVQAIAIEPNDSVPIYAGTNGDGVFKSPASTPPNWSDISDGNLTNTSNVQALAIDPSSTNTFTLALKVAGSSKAKMLVTVGSQRINAAWGQFECSGPCH